MPCFLNGVNLPFAEIISFPLCSFHSRIKSGTNKNLSKSLSNIYDKLKRISILSAYGDLGDKIQYTHLGY